jgi:hypothetical protein
MKIFKAVPYLWVQSRHDLVGAPEAIKGKAVAYLKIEYCCSLKPYSQAGNTNWGGRLSTVDLLIKVACLVTKVNYIFIMKRTWSKLVSTLTYFAEK